MSYNPAGSNNRYRRPLSADEERASVQRGRLLVYFLDMLPTADWPMAKQLVARVWRDDLAKPPSPDGELTPELKRAANAALRDYYNPAARAAQRPAARTPLRIINRQDGQRIYTLAPESVGPLDMVHVTVSRLGHWRRWDDPRRDNGDAVCAGCYQADSWQRMDDHGPCPADLPTDPQIRKVLTRAPAKTPPRPAVTRPAVTVPLPTPRDLSPAERTLLHDLGLSDGVLAA